MASLIEEEVARVQGMRGRTRKDQTKRNLVPKNPAGRNQTLRSRRVDLGPNMIRKASRGTKGAKSIMGRAAKTRRPVKLLKRIRTPSRRVLRTRQQEPPIPIAIRRKHPEPKVLRQERH